MRKLGKISLVVPCYNEQEVIASTHERLSAILGALVKASKCTAYEIVYVNDGSSDNTQKILEEIFSKDTHVRVIALRRNFGFQGALCAGLVFARGEAMVTIDADLQDPPEKIQDMIAHYEQGYDLVLGVREDRQSDTLFKKFTAENFYRLMKALGADIVYNHADFRLMARPLVDEFNMLNERNRFIRGMVLALDNHYATVSYKRQARQQGVTKFNFNRMLSFSLDGIFSFTFMPLRIISIVGAVCFMLALGGIVYAVLGKIFGHALPGWTSTVLPNFVFHGFEILSIGLIGEYVGRLYVEVKQRPIFSVRRELTHENNI